MQKRIYSLLLILCLLLPCAGALADGLPKALSAAWQGTATEKNGGEPLLLTLTVGADGLGEILFDQDGHQEVCQAQFSQDTFKAADGSSHATDFEGLWALQGERLILDFTRVMPSGASHGYTAICARMGSAQPDPYYAQGVQYLKEEKYYSAYAAFYSSSAAGADALAESCVQPWPKNGEIWRNMDKKGNMELTIDVNQSEDSAMLFKIYKDGEAVSALFVGGPGKATVTLPGGVYGIKEGAGDKWFGPREAFGRKGYYKTMTFDENGSETVNLKADYAYTLSINISKVDPDAAGVGAERETWENFAD